MAGYRVESTQEDAATCVRGWKHLRNASIHNGPMPNQIKDAEELRNMQAQGDTFVLVDGGKKELDWPRITFDPCACGHGTIMVRGKSANQLVQQVRNP